MVRTILVKPSTLYGRIPARHRYQYKPRRGGLEEADVPRQAPHLLRSRLILRPCDIVSVTHLDFVGQVDDAPQRPQEHT